MTDAGDFETLSLLDADAIPLGDDGLQWIPVRRAFDIGAFGVNAFRADRAGDEVIEAHEESPGQEELYLVVTGSARFVIGESEFEAARGTAVFVARPDVRRAAVAIEDGTVVLAVGGWTDQAYHSLPWEPIYLALGAMRSGDWASAVETLEREAGEHRETGAIRYRLACCYARLGEAATALEELRQAIAVKPDLLDRAREEEAFASLRDDPAWPG